MFQHVLIRRVTEQFDAERGPVLKRLNRADRMNTAHEASQPEQVVGVVEFRCAAPAARKQREAETGVFMQGFSLRIAERGDDGNLALGQFQAEGMFLQDRLIGPAFRPVELRHQRRAVLDADLIDAVLVTVQAEQRAVAGITGALDGIEDAIGVEALVGGLGVWLVHAMKPG